MSTPSPVPSGPVPPLPQFARRGQRWTDEQIYEGARWAYQDPEFRADLFSHARRELRNIQDVEDAIQEYFLKRVPRLFRSYDPKKTGKDNPENRFSPIPFLWSRFYWFVATQKKKLAVLAAKQHPLPGDCADHKGCAVSRVESDELLQVVRAAVDDLAEPYRTTVRLYYLEQQSYKKMSEETGTSRPALAQRVCRGLRLLRDDKRLREFVSNPSPMTNVPSLALTESED